MASLDLPPGNNNKGKKLIKVYFAVHGNKTSFTDFKIKGKPQLGPPCLELLQQVKQANLTTGFSVFLQKLSIFVDCKQSY